MGGKFLYKVAFIYLDSDLIVLRLAHQFIYKDGHPIINLGINLEAFAKIIFKIKPWVILIYFT